MESGLWRSQILTSNDIRHKECALFYRPTKCQAMEYQYKKLLDSLDFYY